MQITMIAAGVMGLLLLTLSMRVAAVRRANSISIGDGGNAELMMRGRAQANCAEYAAIGVLLIFLAEQAYGASWFVISLAALFVIGRLMHPFGMAKLAPNVFRVAGMIGTWTALGLLAPLVLWAGLMR